MRSHISSNSQSSSDKLTVLGYIVDGFEEKICNKDCVPFTEDYAIICLN